MRTLLLSAALLALPAAVTAAPIRYQLPVENMDFPTGPNQDMVQANCSLCHSNDYLGTQPRNLANPAAFWTAEVVKMRNAYKAPIDETNIGKIVEYLILVYGK